MLDYDSVLRRWNCAVCGWSWTWRSIVRVPNVTRARE
jgi:hypothetical protein